MDGSSRCWFSNVDVDAADPNPAADGGVGANYGPVVSANLQVLRKILEQQRSNAAAAAAAESASRKVG